MKIKIINLIIKIIKTNLASDMRNDCLKKKIQNNNNVNKKRNKQKRKKRERERKGQRRTGHRSFFYFLYWAI